MEKYVPYEDFAKYFVELVKEYSPDIKQVELAKMLNIGQGYISKIMRGERLPTPENVERIKELWNIDLTDKIKEARNNKSQYSFGGIEESSRIPFMDVTKMKAKISGLIPCFDMKAFAGSLTEYTEGSCELLEPIPRFRKYDFTIKVSGNSMEPEYKNGDEVACRILPLGETIRPGEVYVVNTRSGIVIKRLLYGDNGYICRSINPEYGDFVVAEEDIFNICAVVGIIRIL